MIRFFLLSLSLISVSASALGARDLIPDAERLYAQLGPHEPERKAVALRLADLLFDAAVEIDGDGKAKKKDMDQAEAFRKRSKQLYEESLTSTRGASHERIEFQLSRLYAFAGRMDSAMKYWADLAKHSADVHLKRESALHLAEQLELSNKPESIREAGRLYALSLPLAEKQSLRAYIHYRSAWTQFRLGQTDSAVATLQKSLALTTTAKEREDLLRDMVLFLSRQSQPAEKQMALLRDYGKKYGREGLVAQLGEAYFTADRKEDYVTVMTALNRKEPRLERSIALLDADHDRMSAADVREALSGIQSMGGQTFPDTETEKRARDRLYRLVLLWDGQRRSQVAGSDPLFAQGVDTLVQIFPESDETHKAIGGWMAAHPDKEAQLAELDHWLKLNTNTKLEITLHQNKLELARQLKRWNVVVAESKSLEQLASSQTREARYQRAKAFYELKKYDEALPLFLGVAGTDEIGKFSQDLALDIYASQKRYADIVAATARWKTGGARGQELVAMGEKARFEWAVARQDQTSLAEFTDFCLNKKFVPQSCDNARALAARLRDQDKLIAVLRAEGREDELAQQLEFGGRFSESARLLEKSAKSNLQVLKVALLFELQGEMKERDRVLKNLVHQLSKRNDAIPTDEQALLFATLSDAGVITKEALRLPWAANYQVQVAARLSADKDARKILLEHCEGPAEDEWTSVHLAQLKESYERERKIQFVGAHSKANFEKRVAELKKFSTQADCFMKGAPEDLRPLTAAKVAGAYQELAEQIRATPIPDGLDEATLVQVKEQVNAMAQPFEESSAKWKALAPEADAKEWAFTSPDDEEDEAPAHTAVAFDWKPWLDEIRKNPYQRLPQENLKAHFEQIGSGRLATYMNGRLQGLETQ
jgi:hypothetical protein